MEAVLILDAGQSIFQKENEFDRLKKIVNDFKSQKQPVLWMNHGKENNALHPCTSLADIIIEVKTPSCYFNDELGHALENHSVTHLFIVGCNKDSCCHFISLSAAEKGYKVTLINGVSESLNPYASYEMKGLDMNGQKPMNVPEKYLVENVNFEEYQDSYNVI